MVASSKLQVPNGFAADGISPRKAAACMLRSLPPRMDAAALTPIRLMRRRLNVEGRQPLVDR
jgi:hypothetical protein